jgi:hypothetical protein
MGVGVLPYEGIVNRLVASNICRWTSRWSSYQTLPPGFGNTVPDNRWLREAFENSVPVIYFLGNGEPTQFTTRHTVPCDSA